MPPCRENTRYSSALECRDRSSGEALNQGSFALETRHKVFLHWAWLIHATQTSHPSAVSRAKLGSFPAAMIRLKSSVMWKLSSDSAGSSEAASSRWAAGTYYSMNLCTTVWEWGTRCRCCTYSKNSKQSPASAFSVVLPETWGDSQIYTPITQTLG